MGKKSLKVGDKTTTGHVVAEILGDSPVASVYMSANNELRWTYYGNRGQLPDALGVVIARFDSLMAEIRLLGGTADTKRSLYGLLGKNLFLALNSRSPVDLTSAFAEAERHILAASEKTGPPGTRPASAAGSPFDIAIVCALHDPELSAVLSLSKCIRGPLLSGDPQTYYSTTWPTRKRTALRVVVAAPNQMGLTAAGVLAAKMVLQFQPRLVAMVGVAAGTKTGTQGFGDVLVPEHTFDYGSGKSIRKGKRVALLASPNPLPINAKLLGRLKEWQRERTGLDGIARGWKAAKPTSRIELHTGPMFSSPTVLQTATPIHEVMQQWRKLAGVEMEAHAVHRACNDTIDPPPLFLCAKSICDFAEGKNDDWQHYAAFTAAHFLQRFVAQEWEDSLVQSARRRS